MNQTNTFNKCIYYPSQPSFSAFVLNLEGMTYQFETVPIHQTHLDCTPVRSKAGVSWNFTLMPYLNWSEQHPLLHYLKVCFTKKCHVLLYHVAFLFALHHESTAARFGKPEI